MTALTTKVTHCCFNVIISLITTTVVTNCIYLTFILSRSPWPDSTPRHAFLVRKKERKKDATLMAPSELVEGRESK